DEALHDLERQRGHVPAPLHRNRGASRVPDDYVPDAPVGVVDFLDGVLEMKADPAGLEVLTPRLEPYGARWPVQHGGEVPPQPQRRELELQQDITAGPDA